MGAASASGYGAPNLGLSGGAFGMGPSFSIGWNMADQTYMDMNGDQFPDVVNKDWTMYSDPRGGRRCLKTDGTADTCMGAGVGDRTNSGFSVSVGGNLNGAVGQSTVNSAGSAERHQGRLDGEGRRGRRQRQLRRVPGNRWRRHRHLDEPRREPARLDAGHLQVRLRARHPFDVDSQSALADVNGDGLPDRVRVNQTGVYVRFGLGYRFSATWEPWARSLAFEQSESVSGSMNAFGGVSASAASIAGPLVEFSAGVSTSASTNFARWSWNDVNGDGLLDALHKDDDGVKVRFGTGTGLSAPTRYGETAARQGQFLASGGTSSASSSPRASRSGKTARSVSVAAWTSPSGSRCASPPAT